MNKNTASNAPVEQARVIKLNPRKRFGIAETAAGEQIYFNMSSWLIVDQKPEGPQFTSLPYDGRAQIQIGSEIVFERGRTRKGPRPHAHRMCLALHWVANKPVAAAPTPEVQSPAPGPTRLAPPGFDAKAFMEPEGLAEALALAEGVHGKNGGKKRHRPWHSQS